MEKITKRNRRTIKAEIGEKRKYTLEKMEEILADKPDAYLSEIAERFEGGTTSGVHKALKRMKITVKKTTIYEECNEEDRKEYEKIIANIPLEKRVYVDETGIDKYIYREKARSVKGQKVYDKISGKKYKRTNIVAAKCANQIIAPMEYQGTTDHILFECCFVNVLLPLVEVGMFIIMDNASFHRKEVLKELVKKSGVSVIFLPAYSPDYNPIEKYWTYLKATLRKIIKNFSTFNDALMACFQVE